MKKITFLLLIMMMIHGVSFAKDNQSNSDTQFVDDFLEFVLNDEPFTIEYEERFFGKPYSLYGAILLIQLGVLNEQLQWTNGKPEVAYLGNLLKKNKDIFNYDGYSMKYEASLPGSLKNATYVIKVFQQPDTDNTVSVEKDFRKIMIFNIWTTPQGEKAIVLEDSSINGQSIPYLLGFRTHQENQIKESKLKDEEVKSLNQYIDNQQKK